MKRVLFLAVIVSFAAISSKAQGYTVFGESFKPGNSLVNVNDLTEEMKDMTVEVKGEVVEVCQVKGCWMKIKMDNGETMRVTFKDYGFFMPKDLAGNSIIFKGVPTVATTSVEDLQHYAKDAGRSDAEVAQITQPKVEMTFEATGVLVPAAF
ncbi:DUF4920 domain-containing protein [Jiulongibacter sediminis]|uniref:Amino acid aminotransferase n=1 Tax=Jiulongibacter sediminis TaxID=1605367 RepID=A0A0P7CA84_9BACT|nr:DUF4920 domain-containing protein [Jiulongibacter sediminis]KPM49528.1 amino acid aminotransferase [Jiulongibacter sediminis]TBX26570.1 amino acid aminotransferase [Jiulongibacter sediminis]